MAPLHLARLDRTNRFEHDVVELDRNASLQEINGYDQPGLTAARLDDPLDTGEAAMANPNTPARLQASLDSQRDFGRNETLDLHKVVVKLAAISHRQQVAILFVVRDCSRSS